MLGLILNPCGKKERARCQEQTPDPAMQAWNCQECNRVRPESLHPYTALILRLHDLKQAGYPLDRLGLNLEAWLDLGAITEALHEAAEHRRWRTILRSLISRSR